MYCSFLLRCSPDVGRIVQIPKRLQNILSYQRSLLGAHKPRTIDSWPRLHGLNKYGVPRGFSHLIRISSPCHRRQSAAFLGGVCPLNSCCIGKEGLWKWLLFKHIGSGLKVACEMQYKCKQLRLCRMWRNNLDQGAESDERAVRTARTARTTNRGVAFARL